MSARNNSAKAGRVSLYAALGAIVFAPLPIGMVDTAPLVFYVATIVFALVVAVLVPSLHPTGREPNLVLSYLVVVIVAFVVVAFLQNDVNGMVTPHPIWKEASTALGIRLQERATIVADLPFQSLGPPVAMMATFLVFYLHGQDIENKKLVFAVIAWTGFAYGAISAIILVIDPTMLIWKTKTFYLSNLTGPFVNRNTAATYFGTCALIFELLALQGIRRRLGDEPMTFTTVLALLSGRIRFSFIAPIIGFVVCLAFTLMTGSRAGSLLTIFCCMVLVGLYMNARYGKEISSRVLALGALPLLILVVIIAGSSVTHRLERQGVDDEARFVLYRNVLSIIGQHPWLGTGLGTFNDALPLYRDAELPSMVVWDRAHNTILELASDGGVPLTLIVVSFYIFCAVLMWTKRLSPAVRESDAAIMGFSIGLLACLHSLVDFSLQIPGYAVIFSAIMGSALSCSQQHHPNEVVFNQERRERVRKTKYS